MTPILGSVTDISGNIPSKRCHRSLAVISAKLEFMDIISLYCTSINLYNMYQKRGVILPATPLEFGAKKVYWMAVL